MEDLQILREIEQMDNTELDAVLRAVMSRYRVLFPEWEAVYFTLPKNDPKEREKYLEWMTEFLMKHYEGAEKEDGLPRRFAPRNDMVT